MTIFHRVDKILLWLMPLGALFTGFMTLTGDRMPLSALLASAACLGLKRASEAFLARMRGRSRRARRRYARSLLSQWALLPEAEAIKKLRALFESLQRSPCADGPLLLLPLSPASGSFNADCVISTWQKSQGESHITLAAFCPAGMDARRWAEKLDHPSVHLIDGPMIEKQIMETCPVAPAAFSEAARSTLTPDWRERLLRRIHPVKAGLCALLMLLLYLLGGGMARLVAFGLLFALTLLSLRDRMMDQSASRSILEFLRALR